MCMLLPIFCYFLAAKIKKIQFSCSFIYGQVSPLSRFAYHVRYRGCHALPWYLHVPGLNKSANGRAAYHKSTVWLLGQPIAWNQKSRLEITPWTCILVLLYGLVIYQTDRVRAEASWVFHCLHHNMAKFATINALNESCWRLSWANPGKQGNLTIKGGTVVVSAWFCIFTCFRSRSVGTFGQSQLHTSPKQNASSPRSKQMCEGKQI